MSRRKRLHHSGGASHERWLVSYADFITLLFAFFLMLYAVSSLNESKYRAVAASISKAFIKDSAPPTTKFDDNPVVREDGLFFGQKSSSSGNQVKIDASLAQTADAISQEFQPLISGGQIGVQRQKDWVAIELKSALLFETGEGFPKKEAIPVLKELAKILNRTVNPLRIEGYTDNVPIENNVYPSNWDLSAARAASIVRKFQEFGVDPTRMVAVGYGEQHPGYSNETESSRANNRRVVIIIGANSHWNQ